MQYNDGSVFSVKATNSAGKALANKNMKITLNGKTTTVVTDSEGVAKLTVGAIKPGTYTVKSTYSTAGKKDYNTDSNTVKITKQTATDDLVMEYNDWSSFEATVKNKTGSTVYGVNVHFTYNGQTISSMTDKNGVSAFAVTDGVGYYPVDIQIVDTRYTSSKISKHILVNGTVLISQDLSLIANLNRDYSVRLLDAYKNPIANAPIEFSYNGISKKVGF